MTQETTAPPLKKTKRKGLNRFLGLRRILVDAKRWYYRRIWGMNIHPTAQFSLSTKFDISHPHGVNVGAQTYIAFETRLLCHDVTRGLSLPVKIGENCFIGGRSMIMPGVEIGNNCIIGAGSIVTKSVPDNCIAAGNPAVVIRTGIEVGPFGRFLTADQVEHERVLAQEAGAA